MPSEASAAETLPQISAVSSSYAQITVNWAKVDNASGYEIYRCGSGGVRILLGSVGAGTFLFRDSGLKTGSTYSYCVRASYTDETGSVTHGGFSAACSARPVPSAAGVSSSVNSRRYIKVKWSKVAGASGYYVYRASSMSGRFRKVKTTSAKKTVFTNTSIKAGKTYYYKVKAYKKVDSKKIYGKYSAAASASNGLKYKKTMNVKTCAYTGGGHCANGKKAKVGRVAVDKRVIPIGTWMYIPGYGLCQACDTGVKGKTIDLYMNKKKECVKWGLKKKKIYIIGKTL